MPYKDYILKNSEVIKYIGLDIESALVYDESIKPDFYWDGLEMPFSDDSFQSAMATEVLEHCKDPEIVLSETFRVLKPGGIFFFTVPFIWNLHEVPNDEYRYTPFSLRRHLKNSGFEKIEIQATGGWHLSLAQMLGLWYKRSSLNDISIWNRRMLKILIPLIIKRLMKLHSKEKIEFTEGQMISGIYGIAYK
jgi:SAM-dependent methyltransferase